MATWIDLATIIGTTAMPEFKVGDKVVWVQYTNLENVDYLSQFNIIKNQVVTVLDTTTYTGAVIVSMPDNPKVGYAIAMKTGLIKAMAFKSKDKVNFSSPCRDIKLVSPELASVFQEMQNKILENKLTKVEFMTVKAQIKPLIAPLSKQDDEESDYIISHVKEMLATASKHVVAEEHPNKVAIEQLRERVLRDKVPF